MLVENCLQLYDIPSFSSCQSFSEVTQMNPVYVSTPAPIIKKKYPIRGQSWFSKEGNQ